MVDTPLQPALASSKSRPDVGRLYGGQYKNAGESGFFVGMLAHIVEVHDYTLISRYATNSDDANPSDHYFHLGVINQNTRQISGPDEL